MLRVLLWSSFVTLLYVYAGYPWLLALLVRVRGARRIEQRDITPTVTLIVSAFNEAHVIREKIENSLALDYPAGAFDVLVVSDASDDGTDDVVREYAGRGVSLHRQESREGKTAGLNAAIGKARGEILVFSDANSMYDRMALRKLVQNFADPAVGCVTGESRYIDGQTSTADAGERTYWDYESRIKRLESALGSAVGADGAIYAIRRSLWKPLPKAAINDFLNPLQITAAGWRNVYEPEAVCFEQTAGSVDREFRRRVRIVSRSWRALYEVPRVLNPFAVGLFALAVLSHKVLRWLSLAFVVTGAAAFAGLLVTETYHTTELVGFSLLVLLGYALAPSGRRVAGLVWYFLAINAASLVGVGRGILGYVSPVWSTPRESVAAAPPTLWRETGGVAVVTLLLSIGLVLLFHRFRDAAAIVFWAAVGLTMFSYVAYPLSLALLKTIARRPVLKGNAPLSVTMLVAANDEASVIRDKIENCLQVDYPRERFDVVIASDGSVDGTNDIVEEYADRGVRLFALPERRGKMSALNAGMTAVRSDVVVLSDANVFAAPDAIRRLVENFADPAVGAVSADVVLVGERAALAQSEDTYYRYERWLQRAESDTGSMIGVDGALYAIRRELFTPQPPDTILDDMAIPMGIVRSGHRVVFEPTALAHEAGVKSAREEFFRKSRIVAGAVQFVVRHVADAPGYPAQVVYSFASHKCLRWLAPVFSWLAALAAIALADHNAVFLTAAIVVVAGGLLALAGCIPSLRRYRPFGLPHYAALVHVGAALGFVRGLFRLQPATWQRFSRASVR